MRLLSTMGYTWHRSLELSHKTSGFKANVFILNQFLWSNQFINTSITKSWKITKRDYQVMFQQLGITSPRTSA